MNIIKNLIQKNLKGDCMANGFKWTFLAALIRANLENPHSYYWKR
jgi:hypothetical protein